MERVEIFGRKTTPLEKGFAIVSGVLMGADAAAMLQGHPKSGLLELGAAIGLTGGAFVNIRDPIHLRLRKKNRKE